jgi:hypothetical protein
MIGQDGRAAELPIQARTPPACHGSSRHLQRHAALAPRRALPRAVPMRLATPRPGSHHLQADPGYRAPPDVPERSVRAFAAPVDGGEHPSPFVGGKGDVEGRLLLLAGRAMLELLRATATHVICGILPRGQRAVPALHAAPSLNRPGSCPVLRDAE